MFSATCDWFCTDGSHFYYVVPRRKKLGLEQEKAQKEADIKISNSEVLALQKEFDAVSTTVNQLETQKCEAQKRLDELDDKVRPLQCLF